MKNIYLHEQTDEKIVWQRFNFFSADIQTNVLLWIWDEAEEWMLHQMQDNTFAPSIYHNTRLCIIQWAFNTVA